MDITALFARYNKLEAESNYVLRKRQEEAEAAVDALSGISAEDVEELKDELPELATLKSLTVEQIIANEHGELAAIQKFYSDATALLDSWLRHYEEQLQ